MQDKARQQNKTEARKLSLGYLEKQKSRLPFF